VAGVELSADFIGIARKNAKSAVVTVDFIQGNASSLPFEDSMFDFVVCMAAFKNFSEPQKAMNEMHRVLCPQGIALIIDMNRENTNEDIEEEMNGMPDMNWFDRWFVRLSFRTFLKKGAYTQKEFEEFIAGTKFVRHDISKRGTGFYIWMYKR